jgi:hypothetical protein
MLTARASNPIVMVTAFFGGTAATWRQREFSRSRNAAMTPMNFVSG